MFALSHVEFILLTLLHEQAKCTGYQLNTLIDERGYRDWADIGTTSIYAGLKKLKAQGYVTSATDRYKTGKGPKGVKFTLTPEGLAILQSETRQGLAMAREHGERFMLAMSALPVLADAEVVNALNQRKVFLQQDFDRIQQKYEQQCPLPLHADLLFQYSLAAIKQEIAFTETMLTRLQQSVQQDEIDRTKDG